MTIDKLNIVKYVKVILDLSFGKPLTYNVPVPLETQAKVGMRCIVPVGKNRRHQAFIISVVRKPKFKTKSIIAIPDDVSILSPQMLKFTKELSRYYYSPWIKFLKAAVPPALGKKGLKVNASKSKKTKSSYNPPSYSLNDKQKRAISQIVTSIKADRHEIFLIHGITGSGKTEIYLESIFASLEQKKGAIFLVPEISLTPQMIRNFRERFGERLALYHSGLTSKQRRNEWMRIKMGEADIVLGVRSAIFAPVENLGAIVIDESHETTYKQEENLRYSAVQAAFIRGKLKKCPVILGSATPAIETYYNAKKGKYTLIQLTSRVDNKYLPEVIVVDMNKEKLEGNKNIISRRLRDAIKKTVGQGEQVVLFLNRRGFSSVVMCRICGYIPRCKNCHLSLIYHSSINMLMCHHCGYKQDIPPVCPRCHKSYLKPLGMGTQKVEKEIKKISSDFVIQRMDSDVTSKEKNHREIFKDFLDEKINILVGTQMLAKGLHFPNVTLVGIISADTQLNLPNFRAGEFTFQLLTQVAGRAGRGEKGGQVILQTYNPDHYGIRCAKDYDFDRFYDNELSFRKHLKYPPFSQLISLTVKGASQNKVRKNSVILASILKEKHKGMEFIGPGPCPIEKIRNKYRWQIIIKSTNKAKLAKLMRNIRKYWNKIPHKNESLLIDIDPVNML